MRYSPALALIGIVCAGSVLLSHPASSQNDPPYVVENGRVDQATYNGYRRYTESCHRCHGPDGAGSSYAPALMQSLSTMDFQQFAEVVVNGRKNVNAAAENVMPAFGTVEDVVLYLNDMYGYLKARSDGKLGRGRPKRVGDDDD